MHKDPRSPRSDTPNPTLGMLCSEIARLYSRSFEAALAEEGVALSSGPARALFYIDRCGTPRLTELAAAMSIETMTVVRFVDQLEEAGLVARMADPADRRSKRVAPTEKAGRVLEVMHRIAQGLREDSTQDLTPEEKDLLLVTLQKVRDRLLRSRSDALAEAP